MTHKHANLGAFLHSDRVCFATTPDLDSWVTDTYSFIREDYVTAPVIRRASAGGRTVDVPDDIWERFQGEALPMSVHHQTDDDGHVIMTGDGCVIPHDHARWVAMHRLNVLPELVRLGARHYAIRWVYDGRAVAFTACRQAHPVAEAA